jgi:pimeloyl-ACP methyl ester carboxylesterase
MAGPLSADDWDNQMLFFLSHGYRVIAHDRRGHGRSDQTDVGHDMDTYAADVAAIVETLGLRDVIHVGHSTGGGEVTRYAARAPRGRVAQAVLIAAIPPVMIRSTRIRTAFLARSSTGSARRWSRTAHSSTATCRAARSTASTGKARRSARA